MASIALLVGGALVDALAFSGSNFLFSMLRDPSPARSENDMTRLWNSSKPPRSNGRANVLNALTGLMKICGARDMLCTPFVMLMKPFASTIFVIMGLGATTFVAYTLTK